MIERCARAAEAGDAGIEPYDVDVLKLLYLIRYIDNDVPANLDNIVILMADDIRVDKIALRETVRDSLNRLHSQNYIGRSGETYNVGSGHAVSIQSVLDKIIELSGTEIKVEVDKERFRPVDVPFVEADVSKLKNDTGWERKLTLEESLEDILQFFAEQQG